MLRSPQTASERALSLPVPASTFFAGQALHDVHIKLVSTLTRVVQLDRNTKLVVFVVRSSLGPPNYYLGGVLVSGGTQHYLAAGWPFIPFGNGHTAAKWGLFASQFHRVAGLGISIVPDHVARVRWTFRRDGARLIQSSVSVAVRENIAAAAVAPGAGEPAITEYASNGRTLPYPITPSKP